MQENLHENESPELKGRARARELAYIGLVGSLSGVLAAIGESPLRTEESIRDEFKSAIMKSLGWTADTIPETATSPSSEVLLDETFLALNRLADSLSESSKND